MLKCKDGTYYIGYTNDLEKRVKAHNEGKGAKYTKGRGPGELIYFEEYEEKNIAMRKEWEMKRLQELKAQYPSKSNAELNAEFAEHDDELTNLVYSQLRKLPDERKG